MNSGIVILLAIPLIVIGFRAGYIKGHKKTDKVEIPEDFNLEGTPIFDQMSEDFPLTHLLLTGKELFNKNPELYDRLVKNSET